MKIKKKTASTGNTQLTAQLIQYHNNNINEIQIENKLNDFNLAVLHTEYKLRASKPVHASSFSYFSVVVFFLLRISIQMHEIVWLCFGVKIRSKKNIKHLAVDCWLLTQRNTSFSFRICYFFCCFFAVQLTGSGKKFTFSICCRVSQIFNEMTFSINRTLNGRKL